MPPKLVIVKKPDFLDACKSGNTQTIIKLFKATKDDLYQKGLDCFLTFLLKNSPAKNDYVTIRAHQEVLQLFATHLDLYDQEYIATQIKKLHDRNLPAAKTLFRTFLRRMTILYSLDQNEKDGCARFPVSTKQEYAATKINDFVDERGKAHKTIHYPILRLLYKKKKTGEVKHVAELGRQHIELKAKLPKVSEGNVATAALTFMLKVERKGENKKYLEITVPIVISRNASFDKISLNFDDLVSDNSYDKLEILFNQGLQSLGFKEKQHGHFPDYKHPEGLRAADSIKHTEQGLALYLYKTENVKALVKQLANKLRNNVNIVNAGDVVKVIAATLHFHSQKTPCAACETVLAGLMDRETGGFLSRLKTALSEYQGPFKFTSPKVGIRLHVLYSADDIDCDHKQRKHQDIDKFTEHSMKEKSGVVFCSLFKQSTLIGYSDMLKEQSTPDYTVLSSGGSSSEKKRKTNFNANTAHQKSLNGGLAGYVSFMTRLEEAAKEENQEKKLKRYNEFSNWLFEQHGIHKKQIPGDGNCQFTAIAEQLLQTHPEGLPALAGFKDYLNIKLLAGHLRSLAANYMDAHRHEFAPYIDREDFPDIWNGNIDFDTYLEYIRTNKSWAGEQTLRALANILQLPIFVLHPDLMYNFNQNTIRSYLPMGTILENFDHQRLLMITYNGLNHYDTITERPTQDFMQLIGFNIDHVSQLTI